MKDKRQYQAELRLTALFQQLLRELDLPLEYGDDKAINFKRQQVGVRLREAFVEGGKLVDESWREREMKRIWPDAVRHEPQPSGEGK